MTRIITPKEAQRLLDTPTSIPGSSDWDYAYVNTYLANFIDAGPDLAHTVIQQAEQIKRLQRALSLNVIRGGPNPLTRFEYMYERGELLPDDMEATDE